MTMHSRLYAIALVLFGAMTAGAEEKVAPPSAKLAELDSRVIPVESDQGKQLARMLHQDTQARLQAASLRETQAWQAVKTRADWEKFRDERIGALQRALGQFPPVPKDLQVRVTGKVAGDGYRIHNLVYETRPGLVVTANLYLPASPAKAMPGILISHSHHNPKTQAELQDMGMTWARQGCLVLVPDHLGHGERRQHPFIDARSYPDAEFRVGRQDVYFRHNTSQQLHLVGESLMGWLVWDLMRGIDVLLRQPGIDPDRIILLGAVAGGGDPAAVAAALDSRVAAVVPFNFGGPQPDYPIPENTDRDFYWFGFPYWESTRSLRLGARDGFAHWVIVSAVAPRRLLYANEFGWEEKRDPAWPRMQKVFSLYDKSEHLATVAGRGILKGPPPENTHCSNIGAIHRSKMYPTLEKWFGMAPPVKDFDQRRENQELLCLTPEAVKEFRPRQVHELADEQANRLLTNLRQRLQTLSPEARRAQMRKDWQQLLGNIEPTQKVGITLGGKQQMGDITVERLVLEVERGIQVPMLLLRPRREENHRLPVVVGLAQEGKQAFLKERAPVIAELLAGGAVVCLPEVRGTGETRSAGDNRHWRGDSTTLAQAELMLGQPLLGSRLRDVRAVLHYLRSRPDLAADRLALWGDSFAPANAAERKLQVPLDAARLPASAEPLGGLLALLTALFEDQVRAVHVQNGLASYQSILQSQFAFVPQDVLVPDALTAGDLCDVAAALAPRPLRLQSLVSGLNRKLTLEAAALAYASTRSMYQSLKAEKQLQVHVEPPENDPSARWLLARLRE